MSLSCFGMFVDEHTMQRHKLHVGLIHFSHLDRIYLISRLRLARQKAGLTQEALGDMLGKTQSYVAKYETLEKELDFFEVLALCQALEVRVIDVVSEELHHLLTEIKEVGL
jgi:DNA-binding XRE family transcriptional regulator